MKLSTHMLGDRRVGQFTDLKALDMNATLKVALDFGPAARYEMGTLTANGRDTVFRYAPAFLARGAAEGLHRLQPQDG